MANVLINESTMREIGNAIRLKTGKKDLILPKDMAGEIEGIKAEDTNLVNSVIGKTVKEIYIDTSIGDYAFYNCKYVKPTFGDKCASIGSSAFGNCESITEINTNRVIEISSYAFSVTKNLTKADCPNLLSIHGYAFNSSGLQTIIIRSNSVCVLKNTNAFYSTPIKDGTGYIYVPKSLIDDYKVAYNWSEYADQFRAIEDYPDITGEVSVASKSSMKNVLIDESTMTSIGNAIRSKTGKVDLILPEDMPNEIKNINIGEETKKLKSILNKTIKDIYIDVPVGCYFFRECKYVKPTFGDKCTSIGGDAFRYCRAITEINTNKVTTLGSEAFSSTSLTKADLPNVVNVGSWAFEYDSKLETVILRANKVCSISNTNVFNGTPIKDGKGYIYVPQALIEQYKVATNWVTFAAQFRAIEDYPEITGVSD